MIWPLLPISPGVRRFRSTGGRTLAKHRIYTTSFAGVYPHYVAKAEKKGRTRAEVDSIVAWLTGAFAGMTADRES